MATSPAEEDSYAYGGTGILRNHAHTVDPEQLAKAERQKAGRALVKLDAHPVRGAFDAFHLAETHARIFREIYPFAGEFRRADAYVGKDDPRTRLTVGFVPPDGVVPYLNEALKRHLVDEAYLRDLSKQEFSVKAAELVIQIHGTHPFRDGNSRTTREFVRTVAMNAGWQLDWSRVPKGELLPAVFEFSFDENTRGLPRLIQGALVNRERSFEIQALYEATATGPREPWRGTISEALERSARKSPTQPVFVDASWEDRPSEARAWPQAAIQAILEKTQRASGLGAGPRDFGVREFGAVYEIKTDADVFLRLDHGRRDYPEPLQRALNRSFEKARENDAPSRSRKPEIPEPDGP